MATIRYNPVYGPAYGMATIRYNLVYGVLWPGLRHGHHQVKPAYGVL